MSRRYPSADDLWQRINKEDDPIIRRDLLIEMSRLLLEMDDVSWTQTEDSDSTSALLEYQIIAKQVSDRMQQALPWIDADFKGESLEQELQQVQEELLSCADKSAETLQQLKSLKGQKADLEAQQEELQFQQQELQTTSEVIQNLQQDISQLEQGISELRELLDKHSDIEQQKTITKVLADFNPVLISSLKHYQHLALAWQQHQKENDVVTEGLTMRAESSDIQAMKGVPELAQDISLKLEDYDQLLAKLLLQV